MDKQRESCARIRNHNKMKINNLYILLILFTLTPFLASAKTDKQETDRAIVTPLSIGHKPLNSLRDRHIALWNSHGRYYNQTEGKWIWQRARLMGTVEDMLTTDYTLTYLVPMLENAGAKVFLPRERDLNTYEYIIDNDTHSDLYTEEGKWNDGAKSGFAHTQEIYEGFVNPFEQGTYRWIKSTTNKASASVTWNIPITQSGSYAVYVAYKMVKNGSNDARYKVYHAGGVSEFSVNQTMGGGTWIYLGTFDFEQGGNNRVVLSNQSSIAGRFITADAIKVGGGMGNIARKPCIKPRKATKEALKNQKKEAAKKRKKSKKKEPKAPVDAATTSGMPRYAEAARYWMQWAGVPDTIYSDTGGDNDYGDDTRGRAYWVNYLCGGSNILPKEKGLNIPIDLAFAFHTDAGNVPGDSIIGTMGIYYTGKTRRVKATRFANGVSRIQSERLNDYIYAEIQNDINLSLHSDWTMRKCLNRKYAEARLHDVPSMLLETFSHQNFTDMRWGLDPRFKFTMSRAIYKGILKYLSNRHQTPYVVQPLPVNHMSMQWMGNNEVKISWKAVTDTLEATATPSKYKVYTRRGNYGWDNGTIVEQNDCVMNIDSDIAYSFYVTALNDGGESFPSEILSAYRSGTSHETVMIVNAFDRISAPLAFSDTISNTAGFLYDIDGGVPYKHTVAYTGNQYNFDRNAEWKDDVIDPGFGASNNHYEAQLVAGNTFDYPHCHGEALATMGFSYLSTSDEAVNSDLVDLAQYRYVDVILGKERATIYGNDSTRYDFEALPQPFTERLTRYCLGGGNLLISGAYIGQDANDGVLSSVCAHNFLTDVLHCEWLSSRSAHKDASVYSVIPDYEQQSWQWNSNPNPYCYAVEQTDILYPADEQAVTFLQYDNGDGAAIACIGNGYRCCTLGFPIESIYNKQQRIELFRLIFDFLNP